MQQEQQLLGNMLLDNNYLYIALDILTGDEFNRINSNVFKAMKHLANNEKPVDIITISKLLKSRKIEVPSTGWDMYLIDIQDDLRIKDITKHCEMLKASSIKRQLSKKLFDLSVREDLEIDKIINELNDIVEKSDFSKNEKAIRDLDEEPYKGLEGNTKKYIPTGIKTIDYALNDLQGGLVTLLTGRSNGGKTTLCTQIVANAIQKRFKVFLVNGEEK
ncbi:MAG: DnaB-like helicase N-terminal domain-containing protein, partial [Candidatus Heimdallarchaeaceae archaeon]